jgi:hypothetical protein
MINAELAARIYHAGVELDSLACLMRTIAEESETIEERIDPLRQAKAIAGLARIAFDYVELIAKRLDPEA